MVFSGSNVKIILIHTNLNKHEIKECFSVERNRNQNVSRTDLIEIQELNKVMH